MPGPSIVFLMYHELEISSRSLRQPDAGYARYAVSEHQFREQMQYLSEHGYHGLMVGQALEFPRQKSVAITFDDGSETDFSAAAPILRQSGFGATFYITSGWVGQSGHLSVSQLNELTHQGFEIGCHSMSHAYLTDLNDLELQRETFDAKSRLEQIIGKPVEHFSCPGCRYSRRVEQAARAAGYRTVATSRIHANSPSTSRFALGRVAILSAVPIASFAAICTGEALRRLRADSRVRDAAKHLLGSRLYDRVRGGLLGHQE